MNRSVVVASVGTFHLRFDRMVDWLESWHRSHPCVDLVLQHGVSRQLAGADNREMLTPAELLDLLAAADVVVLQGGAGGIMDARTAGRIPIVIARTGTLGETVDNHQVTFMARLAPLGHIHLADSEQHLHQLLDAALAGSLTTRLDSVSTTEGATNLVALMQYDVVALPTRTRMRRMLWSLRQLPRGAKPLNDERAAHQPAAAAPSATQPKPPAQYGTATTATGMPN